MPYLGMGAPKENDGLIKDWIKNILVWIKKFLP
jgi:hypothetical protein